LTPRAKETKTVKAQQLQTTVLTAIALSSPAASPMEIGGRRKPDFIRGVSYRIGTSISSFTLVRVVRMSTLLLEYRRNFNRDWRIVNIFKKGISLDSKSLHAYRETNLPTQT
jgi:hypothetical protein